MTDHILPSPLPSSSFTPSLTAMDAERRNWLLVTGALGGVAAAATAVPFVSTFAPSERTKALGAAVEVDIDDIAPGSMKTVEWRGKPIWIMRRTPEMVAALTSQDEKLVDPDSTLDALPEVWRNAGRSERPEIFVAIGICTHLGCVPNEVAAGTSNASLGDAWQGGFFCPCHGSTFDLAGRVFKNKPAPINLLIPPHRYVSASRLVIGDDEA